MTDPTAETGTDTSFPLTHWARETGAGLAAAQLSIAYCLSFSALLFHGPLAGGLDRGFSALLVGSSVTGLWIAFASTLVPVAAGPNNPAVAVLAVLAGAVSGLVLGAGGDAEHAVTAVLLAFTLATLATGLALFGLGALRLAAYVRFVPYPVIGGFLAASGWLLAVGGVKVVTGQSIDLFDLAGSFPRGTALKLAVAVAFVAGVFAVKKATGRMNALPMAFLAATLLLDLVLGSGVASNPETWFLDHATRPVPWLPLSAMTRESVDWSLFASVAAEIASAAGVTALALLLDVSALEIARAKSVDLDRELTANGAANILSAPLGGVMGKLSVNGTRLIDETGGISRASGIITALITGAIALFGIDLAHLVPAPVLGGLLMFIGLSVLADVLIRSPARRAWSDYALALLIMLAILKSGYLAGVVLGFVGACLMFALSYSRVGVIRRHLTREVMASNVDRSSEATALLQANGQRIQIFWLSGYLFFGSAHGLFEAIRKSLERAPAGERTYAILDLAEVPGLDTSALLSLLKLRNLADERGLTLVFAGASETMIEAFHRLDIIGPKRTHRIAKDRSAALAWCEDAILGEGPPHAPGAGGGTDILLWLTQKIGSTEAEAVQRFLTRRELLPGDRLYEEGDPADTIDLIASGSAAITIARDGAAPHLVRHMAKRTVVGEMGFFRANRRTATVTAEEPAIVYTLTRDAYARMLIEEPRAAAAFQSFIIRTLSDRLEFANKGLAALS